jgi:hypothetical protein
MGRCCFGAFLKGLSLCSLRSATNKYLCGTMFLTVNDAYDIRTDDGTVGRLLPCTNNVSLVKLRRILTYIKEALMKSPRTSYRQFFP